jgi:hypothetical protein
MFPQFRDAVSQQWTSGTLVPARSSNMSKATCLTDLSPRTLSSLDSITIVDVGELSIYLDVI